jgi:hypothetical protein
LGGTGGGSGGGVGHGDVADRDDGLIVEEYREEQTRSWIYRARHNVDEKVLDASFGHLLSNITA